MISWKIWFCDNSSCFGLISAENSNLPPLATGSETKRKSMRCASSGAIFRLTSSTRVETVDFAFWKLEKRWHSTFGAERRTRFADIKEHLPYGACVCVCVCTVRERQFCEVNVLPTRQHWLIWQIFWQYLKSDLLPLLIFERLTPEVNKRQSRCRTTTGFIFHFPGQRVDICWLHCFWPAESAEKSAAQVKSLAWHFPFSDESASRCQPKPSTPIGQTRHFAAAILL